tara:strand:+ start:1264 stop:1437 length:174 start_codon:yes stop_codon:yes gene_type:complete
MIVVGKHNSEKMFAIVNLDDFVELLNYVIVSLEDGDLNGIYRDEAEEAVPNQQTEMA